MNLFKKIIAGFSAMTGLRLVPDEGQNYFLETDGIIITIQYSQDTDEIVISAPVMDADTGVTPTKAMYEKALSLSYDSKGTFGASLGLFDNKLILSIRLPMQDMDASDFGVKLSAFADAAVSARAEIAAAGNVDTEGNDTPNGFALDALLGQFLRA